MPLKLVIAHKHQVSQRSFGITVEGDVCYIPVALAALFPTCEIAENLYGNIVFVPTAIQDAFGWNEEAFEQATKELKEILEPHVAPDTFNDSSFPAIGGAVYYDS